MIRGANLDVDLPVETKLQKARAHLVLDHPFFGMLLMRMLIKSDENIRTYATDGCKYIYYNPELTKKQMVREVVAELAHEAMHIALLHGLRKQDRHHRIWNYACDYAINPILVKGNFKVGEDWLLDEKYEDQSGEEIYPKLLKEQEKQEKMGNCGQGKGGSSEIILPHINGETCSGLVTVVNEKGEPVSEAELSMVITEVKKNIASAVAYATQAGKMPADLKRLFLDNLQPKINWRDELRHFLECTAKNDFCWTKPNRRYLPQGIYLPGLQSQELGTVVNLIDTSGSISNEQIAQFMAEEMAILEAFNIERFIIVYFDDGVHNVQEFTSYDLPIKPEPVGGGGTNFIPPFNWIDDNQIEPRFIIVMTDLYCHDYPEEPDCPVLWAVAGNAKGQPRFGIKLTIED